MNSSIVTGEYGVRGDLSDHIELSDILVEVEDANPNDTQKKNENHSRQLFTLLHEIQPGDLIVHPHNDRKSVAIGMAKPGHKLDADQRPSREVEWLRRDIPKENLQQDFHHTMAAGAQICEMTRNRAVDRVEALVADGIDPGPSMILCKDDQMNDPEHVIPLLEARMIRQVGSLFAGHELANLIGALLEADGYGVKVSPPGPDGGCDLLAARGSLGIEGPTIACQVKSGDIKCGDPVLQGLRGVIQARGADKGLLVSWGGVTRTVARELDVLQLQIAYWDAAEICRRLIRDYEKMPLWVRDRLRVRMVPVLELA